MASNLLKYGLDHSQLYFDFITAEYNLDYLMLEKIAIENMVLIDNEIAITFLSYNDIQRYPYDTPKNFVDLGKKIKGVEVSLIFIEENPNTYKVSLRSKTHLDVSEVAKKFGGGGHKFASGIRFIDNYEKMRNDILREVKKSLNDFTL